MSLIPILGESEKLLELKGRVPERWFHGVLCELRKADGVKMKALSGLSSPAACSTLAWDVFRKHLSLEQSELCQQLCEGF